MAIFFCHLFGFIFLIQEVDKLKEVQTRYSKIYNKFPREFLLLQGTGCVWKKCTFCDYFYDISTNPFEINKKIINKITGEFGVLDIINSGSIMELDSQSLDLIIKKAHEKKVREIWFEAHWIYKNKLEEFSKKFGSISIKYRTGIETFNTTLRDYWRKGIPKNTNITDIKKYFQAVCLLIGIKNQTLLDITRDISIALENFEHISLSVFEKNSTNTIRDENLIKNFVQKIYPKIADNPKIEILINNTDLGVG